jgi:hypothetical protein
VVTTDFGDTLAARDDFARKSYEPQPEERDMSRLLCVMDCRVGMKVRHIMTSGKSRGAGDGEVMAVGPDGVLVHYPTTGVNGLYDDNWFRVTGAILEHVPTVDTPVSGRIIDSKEEEG